MSTPCSEFERWGWDTATLLTDFQKTWEFGVLEIEFYEVSWRHMSSLVTPDTPGSLHLCPGSFSRSLIFDDFWWISGVLMWGECFAPLLLCKRSAPSFKSQILSKWRILDSDPHDFQRRFQLCPPQVLNPTTDIVLSSYFDEIHGISGKNDFLKSRFMKSRGVKSHP